MVDDKQARVYRAVPAADLLAALEQSFKLRTVEALRSLQKIAAPAADDRLYHLKTVAQVMQRSRAMIAASREILLFDLFPGPLESLRADLERAAARKVVVAGVTYGDMPPLRIAHIYAHSWNPVSEAWPGQQVSIVSDAGEYLVALLARAGDSVIHGMWTDSAYLSCLQHAGLASEIQIAAIQHVLTPALHSLGLLNARPPGIRRLLGEPGADAKRKKR